MADDVEAACLVPLELLEEGDKRPGYVRIAVLVIVGISEDNRRDLTAYEVLAAKNGALALVELFRHAISEWIGQEGGTGFTSLEAAQHFTDGFLVSGVTEDGQVWRWTVLQDAESGSWQVHGRVLPETIPDTTLKKTHLGTTSHFLVALSHSAIVVWSADRHDLDHLKPEPPVTLYNPLPLQDFSISHMNPRLEPLLAVATHNETSFYRKASPKEPWSLWSMDKPRAAILAAAQVVHATEIVPKSFPPLPNAAPVYPDWYPVNLLFILLSSLNDTDDPYLPEAAALAIRSILPALGQDPTTGTTSGACTYLRSILTKIDTSKELDVPNDTDVLTRLSPTELHQLYALLAHHADIEGCWATISRLILDPYARAFLLCNEIRSHLVSFAPPAEAEEPAMPSRIVGEEDSRLLQSIVDAANKPAPVNEIAGGAVLAALVSSANDQLLSHVFPNGVKEVPWSAIRSLWPALWCRSVAPLRKLAEEVATGTFRRTQNPMKAALLYLALGKRAMLHQLAKASRTDVARSLEKLLQHDTSTERGRMVTEKNAYHLLRKRDYPAAAAIFLLTEPPNISHSLDVLVRHVKDLSLAVLVGRLVESRVYPEAQDGALGPVTAEVVEKDVMPRFQEAGEKGLLAACSLWLGKPGDALDTLGSSLPMIKRGELVCEKALWDLNEYIDMAMTPSVAAYIDPLARRSWKCFTYTAATTMAQHGK